jgi:hypothetical protein
MKALRLLLACTFVGLTLRVQAQDSPPDSGANSLPAINYVVVERGPHHKVIQYQTFETNVVDQATIAQTNLHSYREMQIGMHRKSGQGDWIETSEEVTLAPGGATATNTAHQAFFAANANSAQSVQLTMPDGLTLSSHVLCLSYFDTVSGSNAIPG